MAMKTAYERVHEKVLADIRDELMTMGKSDGCFDTRSACIALCDALAELRSDYAKLKVTVDRQEARR